VLLIAIVILKMTVWSSGGAKDSNAVNVKSLPDEKRASARAAAAEVIEAYTTGRKFWNKRSEEDLKTAIEHFERAIRIDPNFAPAHAGLADSYIMLGAQNYLRPEESGPKAKAAALRALQLDDSLAEAHASMAFVKISYDWDWPGAEEEFKRAIALNPDYALARNWYSQYLLAAGRRDESLREIKLARELDPESIGIQMTAGAIFFRLDLYDQAIEEFRRVIERDPTNASAFKSLGYAYEKKSMFKEADEAYKIFVELSGLPSVRRFSQEFARWSKEDNAEFLLDKISFMLKQKYVRPSYIAGLYARFGEKDRAFDWLERAYRERDTNLLFIKTDDTWDSLRADPRFFSLEQRIIPAS
jgi:tetratricopeptide (TPR) repeat protein